MLMIPESPISLSGISIKFPHESTKELMTSNGLYIPKNIIPTRLQILDDNIYLALPRLKPGVPFTLGKVTTDKYNGKKEISPFPDISYQQEGKDDNLQNVVDIVLDEQNIIWALDTGVVNTRSKPPIRRSSPKIFAIDSNSEKIVRNIDLGNLATSHSLLQYLEVDYASSGHPYIYISDASNRAIIVYDVLNDRGTRVSLPKAVNLGSSIDDMLFMNLIHQTDGKGTLYFTYLSSSRMFRIDVDKLRSGVSKNAVEDVGPKNNKIVLLGRDHKNSIFFRNSGEHDVYKWNTETPFNSDNFELVQNGDEYRLPTHVTSDDGIMWSIDSNFIDYVNNTVPCSGASIAIHPLLKNCLY
ncbi:L-dopachrome tautomerase yellow-f2-like [Aphidius gifuensis]|uniref:L-dopachrome tautomerase yellow-f2-like n=1 Tax=Aphidius gifuensis TaxID=684658 RepID=UPI001CDC9947|nr:L-dopachrome tautomerase yellow-f2-like [Aphidius gifuensis]